MIILVLLLGFVLRIINLNQSLWLDEATQVLLAQKSLYSIFYERAVDFHPPLSYILMHFWLMLGTSETILRMLSVTLGVGTILVLYLLAKELFGKPIALLSAFLLAVSPYHVYYSQEIRMYSLAAFLATLSMLFLVRVIKDQSKLIWLGYIVSTSALIWTLYTGVLLVIAQLLYLIFFERNRLKQHIVSLTLIFISYIPWLPQFLKQLEGGVNIDEYLPGWREILGLELIKSIPLTIFKFTAGRIDFDNNYLYGLLIAAVLLLVGYCFAKSLSGKRSKEVWFIAFWFFIPLISSLLISFKIPLNQPFRLLFIIPAFYILIAYGITKAGKLKNILIVAIIVFSLLGLFLYNTQARFQREDWRGAVSYLNSNINDGVVLFVWPEPFPPYLWYKGPSHIISLTDTFPIKYQTVNIKLESLDPTQKIILFEYLQDLADPNRETQRWFAEHGYQQVRATSFTGVGFLYEYQKVY